MPKYTVPPASLTNLEWLKRIANENAEVARLLRILIGPKEAGNIPIDDG